jgi:ribonuclease P protein component
MPVGSKTEAPKATFVKGEHLKSRTIIQKLFSERKTSIPAYPLRLVWTTIEPAKSEFPVQAAFTVSKKNFKKAVDRNRIKRLMKEAFRLKKHWLHSKLKHESAQFGFVFIYVGKELPAGLGAIEPAMRKIFYRFATSIAGAHDSKTPL